MIRKIFPPRIENHRHYAALFRRKSGLEIGGPSKLFGKRGLIPVYPVIGQLDGCNFCLQTVWEGRIAEGPGEYRYAKGRAGGRQYISDAVSLQRIGTGNYDFVLSSHCLEHVANPFKAISEWLRVVKSGGYFLLVLPHKDGTFDHQRPVTQLRHVIDDFERSIGEDDLGHLPEILDLHDLSMDPPAGDREAFRQRSLKNFENRCLHHHVFDTHLVIRILDYFNLQILDVQQAMPYHIIALSRKLPGPERPDNSAFLSPTATCRSKSPFPTDRG